MTLSTGHVGLNVTDLNRSLAFYRDVLDFDLLVEGKEEDRRFALMGVGGTLTLALWQQADGACDTSRPGLHHLAFQADSVERIRAYESALREYGVEFAHEGIVAHAEGADSGGIFFLDPDGIRLEISVPSGVKGAPAPHESAPTCGFF
ncbi:VOC family protein [Streptomyces sp. NPDC003635]